MDAHEMTPPEHTQETIVVQEQPVQAKSVYEELREAKALATQLHADSEKILRSIDHIEGQLKHQLWRPHGLPMTPTNPYVETMCVTMKIQTPVKLSDFLQDMNSYLVENQLLSPSNFEITLTPILQNGFGFDKSTEKVQYLELLGKISQMFHYM